MEFVWSAQDWLLKGLSLDASAAFTRSKVVANAKDPQSVGKWWLRVPRTRGNLLVAYRPDDRWMGSVGLRHEGRSWNDTYNLDINPNVFGGNSTLNQVDLRVAYKLVRQLELAAGVNNATNSHAYQYRTPGARCSPSCALAAEGVTDEHTCPFAIDAQRDEPSVLARALLGRADHRAHRAVRGLHGLLYVFSPQIEAWRHADVDHVAIGTAVQPLDAQVAAVRAAFPDQELRFVVPAHAPGDTTQIYLRAPHAHHMHSASGEHDHGLPDGSIAYVDPYTAQVVGTLSEGQTPVVRVNNKRHGLSVISTVTNKGTMRWKIFDGALNSDILIDFMKRLIRDAGRKVYLILDNLRVHHSKPVKAWLAEHKREIEVFYLPSYSPELNPDEMANADLKQAVTKLAPARTKLQLVKATAKHLRSVQRQPERIRKYFEHEPVRYAA